jgi:putative endonuclease
MKDRNFYTGFTHNLKKRFQEHNNCQVFSTKSRIPFRLVYYEAYLLEKDATAREQYLKTSMGKRVLKKQLANFVKTTKSAKITYVHI